MSAPPTRRLLAGLLTGSVVIAVAACGGTAEPGVRATSPAAANPSSPSPDRPSETGADPSPPAVPPASAPTAPSARSLTIVAGGDVLLHEPTWAQADADAGGGGTYDFAPQMLAIEPVVAAADLALCHLETPLAPDGGPYTGYPSFSGPPQIAESLAATGFDACSLASNHSWDKGLSGLERTVTTVAAAGVTPYGAAVAGQPGNPTLVDAGDVRVGLLSYTYGSNAAPANGAVEMIDVDDILVDAAAARAAGAEVVVASVHWGTEYSHDINAQQRDLAPVLLASPDLDLLVGHHAHVVQPMAEIGGEWVAYGLGNMLAAHATELPANQEGVLAQFTFTETADGWLATEAAYLPILVDRGPPLRMIHLPLALTDALPDDLRERYETAVTRSREVIHRLAGEELLEITGLT